MDTDRTEMRRHHHGGERRFDRPFGIRQEGCDPGQCLFLFRIEDMEDRADEQGVAGFLPMVPFVERALGIDEDIGNVLDVADLPFAAAHFKQGIIGRGFWVGWIEEQDASERRPESRGELPVLTLDIMDDGASWPGQQRRDDEADTLAAARRGKAQHMFWPVVSEIGPFVTAEYDAIRIEQACRLHSNRATRLECRVASLS